MRGRHALRPGRVVERAGYVTAPGERVRTVVTDLGVLRKDDGELRLAAVPKGTEPLSERVGRAVDACGWPLAVRRELAELDPPAPPEVRALRTYDPKRLFLGPA